MFERNKNEKHRKLLRHQITFCLSLCVSLCVICLQARGVRCVPNPSRVSYGSPQTKNKQSRCQFHQCFLRAFFVRKSFRSFSLPSYIPLCVFGANFVQNTRAKNVDEIDGRSCKLTTERKSLINYYNKPTKYVQN